MSHPVVHAKNSARKFGGSPEDYLAIHEWFDQSKELMSDMRHRALRHHSAGIYECERIFGQSIINSEGKEVFVRYIGEQHVIEDLGFIPTLYDWFESMELQDWMMNRDPEVRRRARRKKPEQHRRYPESIRPKSDLVGEGESINCSEDLNWGERLAKQINLRT